MADFGSKKRGRSDPAEFDSPEVKRLREDLLMGGFDDGDIFPASSELDSFMKSFEEEILNGPSAPAPAPTLPEVVDLTSEPGESRPDFGYLLEASDDELGLPPSAGDASEERTELVRVESDSSGLSDDFWVYGGDLPSYDTFDAGINEFGDYTNYAGADYVALDGLFDYTDLGFGSNDNIWRPGSLHAK